MEMKKNQEQAVAIPQKAQSLVPFPEIQSIAQAFMESGLFPGIQKQAQAVVKIVAGQELGFPPMFSMMNIDIVQGRVRLNSQSLASLVKRDGVYDYEVKVHTDQECAISFTKEGKEVYLSNFTIKDAQKAGLVKPDSGWTKYPKAMLFARALSQGVKIACPHLVSGVITMEETGYEEVNGEVTKEGEPPPSAWREFWAEARKIIRPAEAPLDLPIHDFVHDALGVGSMKDWLAQGKSLEDALETLRKVESILGVAEDEVKEPEPEAIPSGQYKSTIYLISVEQQDKIRTLAYALGIKAGKEFDQVKSDVCGRVVNLSEMTTKEGDKIIAFLEKKQEAK